MAATPRAVALGASANRLTLADSYRHCRHVARARARNFYWSFRLLPPEKHAAICAVYAFMRQCDDLSDEGGGDRAGLEEWRAEMRRTLAGETADHPVWPAFADAVSRYRIPHRVFEHMIDGVASDLEPRRFETWEDLYGYCYRVAAVVGISVIHIFGFRDPRAPELAEKCGVAFQLTNILRDVAEDASLGRVYLPAEDLRRFRIERVADSPAMRALLRLEGQRARKLYEESRPLLGMVDAASRPALRAMIDIYSGLLDRIEALDYAVFDRRIALPAARKAWLMLRALF
jgi:phytoene synthase